MWGFIAPCIAGGDSDFAKKVRSVVVEFGSTTEQPALDRNIRGENGSRAQLEQVWKTTTRPTTESGTSQLTRSFSQPSATSIRGCLPMRKFASSVIPDQTTVPVHRRHLTAPVSVSCDPAHLDYFFAAFDLGSSSLASTTGSIVRSE